MDYMEYNEDNIGPRIVEPEEEVIPVERKFETIDIKDEDVPIKVLNGVKFYSYSQDKGFLYKSLGMKSSIIFNTGQEVMLEVGVQNPPNSFVAVNEEVLYVSGLNKAKIIGRDVFGKGEYDNNICAENCRSCIIETGMVKDDSIKTNDSLFLNNCKSMKVFSGESSNISAQNETTADVVILPGSQR